MASNTKQLRNRIKSVNSTLHLTKAMGLVASSKIRKATDAMLKSRSYKEAVTDVINSVVASPECRKSVYLKGGEGKKAKIIVVAGDRGLAGGYNANIFRLCKNYEDAEFISVGKRSCDRFGGEVNYAESFGYEDAIKLSKDLCKDFADGKYDTLGIISSEYVSILTQEAKYTTILPLTPGKVSDNKAVTVFEPNEMQILETAIVEYVAGVIVAHIRESFACEVAARRNAMDSAGKNAQEMIDNLLLEYNRARQGAITQELTEIVAGSGI